MRVLQQGYVKVETELHPHDCPTCGVVYGLPDDLERRRQEDGGSWYCPNGHNVCYTKSEAQNLREQLEAKERELTYHIWKADQDAASIRELEKNVRAQKAAKTRLMRRVTNGVCPCCQRHFVDVERHMTKKHPGEIVSAEQTQAG